ncbi:DnaJ domain-containing protein [Haloferula sp.]|uniref:DnaJ domain-containing protein n=1 Tax=Haloferula sp. TaxID=2497595 RepID=UPI00329CBB29
MIDAYEEFGLKRSLDLGIEEVRAAFRDRGKEEHPDGGGDSERFSKLQEASEILSHPSRRLRHWLELEGVEGSLSGAISSNLVDVFAKIGPRLQEADGLIRERKGAESQLAKAMLEGRVQACREGLEGIQESITKEIDEKIGEFGRIERGEMDGWGVARELAFLEKWQGQVRERFAELW